MTKKQQQSLNKRYYGRPVLDALVTIEVRVTSENAALGTESDPTSCSLALGVKGAGYETVMVLNETALILKPAQRDVIAHNRARGNGSAIGVEPGDMVWYRYRISHAAREQRRHLDAGGLFVPGDYTLKAPSLGFRVNRGKRSETRAQRADAHREGKQPSFRRQAVLTRAAKAHNLMNGEESEAA